MKGESKSEVPWPRGRAWVLAVAPRLRGRPLCITEPSVGGRSGYGRGWPCHCSAAWPRVQLWSLGRGCSQGVPQALSRLSLTLVSTERGEKGRRGGDGGMAESNCGGRGQAKSMLTPRGSLAPLPSGSRWPQGTEESPLQSQMCAGRLGMSASKMATAATMLKRSAFKPQELYPPRIKPFLKSRLKQDHVQA